MSCGDESFTDPVMEDAIDAARAADTLLVAASGNDGWNSVCYPASSPHVMAVGATNQSNQRISYSNYSRKLDVVAPSGVPVANAPSAFINNNYYGSAGGTSLSTPHVAGLAALLKGNDPSLSRTRLTNLIRFRADKVAGMGGNMYHQQYGYGKINLYVTLAVTDGKLPIYRLFRGNTVSHFYTKDPRERDKAVTRLGYRYEGIGFWSLATTSGTVPIYRLFKPATVSHFYTKSASERDKAVSKLGYRYEGVGFRMPSSGAIPVYRLFKPATVSHFYTKSASERDKAVSKLGYRYESVGFKSY
jgi:subtilisin family serine protease